MLGLPRTPFAIARVIAANDHQNGCFLSFVPTMIVNEPQARISSAHFQT